MKTRKFLLLPSSITLSIGLALAGLSGSAQATTYYWDTNGATSGFGTASGTWLAPTPGTTIGWTTSTGGTTATGADITTTTGDGLNFGNGATGLAVGTITVSGTVDAGSLTYASGSGAITLSGGTINLGTGTAATAINSANLATQVINSNMVLGNAVQTISASSVTNTARAMTIGGNISSAGSSSGITTSTGANFFTLNLNGANSYGGATTIGAGTGITLGGSNSGGGSYSLGGASATLTLSSTAGTVVTSGITSTGGSVSRVLNLNGGIFKTTGNVFGSGTTAGVVNFGGGTLLNGNSGTAITVFANGTVTSGVAGATNVNAGGGTADTTGGNITFNVGLNGTAAGALTFQGGNTVFSGVTNTGLMTASGSTTWDLNNIASSVAGLAGSGSIKNDTGGATVKTLTITGTTSDTFSGAIAPTTAANIALTINKSGGVQTLSGANTYTGVTTITAGTLSVGTIGDGGVASGNLGSASNAAANLVFDGGTLRYTGATASTDRNFTINTAKTATVDVNVSGTTLTLNGAAPVSTGLFTKTGAGTLVLAGTNLYSGATAVSQGTLSVSSIANNTGTGTTINLGSGAGVGTLLYTGSGETSAKALVLSAGAAANGGTIDQSGSGLLKFTGSVTANSGQLHTLTLQGSTGGAGELSGVISDGSVTNKTSVTKSGSGTWTLSGANTYTGATAVNGGVLQIGTGNAATLGGGSYAGAISGSGTLAFNSTAAQSLTGGITGGTALTKDGSGALTISSTNALGAVTLTTGTLNFTGTTTAGNTSVASGTTLGGKMTAAGTSVLTLGGSSLTLDTSTLAIDFSALNPTAPIINLPTGTLTLNGTITPTFSNISGLVNGTYTLVDYGTLAGSGSFSGSPISLGARSSAIVSNDADNTNIVLSVSTDKPVWTGVNGSGWVEYAVSTATTGTPNFALVSGHTATDFWTADDVQFNDTYNLGAGDIAVTNGTLTISTGGAVNTNGVAANSATFNNSAIDYTINGTGGITAGSLIKNGTGKVTINTSNTYAGGTIINAGTIAINSAASLGASSGALTLNNGTLQTTANITTSRNINLGNANSTILTDAGTTYATSGVLSGSGILNKNGTGTLTLSGANTYTVGTAINAGVVSIAADNNLGASAAAVTLNGGTLRTTAGITNTHAVTIGAGGGTINVTTTGQYFFNTANTLLGSGPLTVTGNGTLTANTGNLRIAQTDTYSGAVTLNSGGIFEYGVAGAVGAAATFDIGNQGELAVQTGVSLPNAITVSGGTNSALSFENGTTGNLTGSVTLNANAIIGLRDWYNYATVRSGTISGQITGTGGITVNSGTGNGGGLTLSNVNNTYSGGTTISGSKVAATTSGAIGTGAVAISGTGSQLILGGTTAGSYTYSPSSTSISGGGVTAQGIIWAPNPTTGSNAVTYDGPINITGAAASGGHFGSGSLSTLNMTGAITSSVAVTSRIGTVVFSNTGSSFSQLNVMEGTVKLGATNALPVAASVDLGASGAAILDLAGFNQTLSGITKNTNAAAVTNTGASDSTLTTTGTSTFAGVIQNGATNKTALTVSSGALTLTGANTFSGNVTVDSGTLAAGLGLGDPAANTSQSSALGDIGTAVSRNITVNNGGTLSLTSGNTFGTGGSSNTLSGLTLVVNQGGLFQTGTNATGAGFWNKIGAVNLSGGTLSVGSGANSANFQGLALIGTVTVGGSSASTINNRGSSDSGFNAIHLGQNATVNQSIIFDVADVTGNAGADLTVSAKLINTSSDLVASGLTKTGAGTMVLAAANSYTGATVINGGTLQLGDGTTDGTIATTSGVTNNVALVYNWIADHTAAYVISGTGTLTKEGTGKLTLSAEPTYTGNTAISGGTISVSANSATTFADTSTISVATGAVLDLPNATTDVVASLVLNGVAQPAGTYDSATPGGYITGAGKIQVGAAAAGYAAWALANAPGQTKDQDHDNDGVQNGIEYFMGLSGDGFTASPALSGGTVTWTKGGSYTGTYGTDFVVQSSTDLVNWTDVPVGSGALGTVANDAGSVAYTPPTGQSMHFGRLVVNN